MLNIMNKYEFISLLLFIPFAIYFLNILSKFIYRKSINPTLKKLYRAKAMYENIEKFDSSIIRMVLDCDLYCYYIKKDKDLLDFVNKVLVKVGRKKI